MSCRNINLSKGEGEREGDKSEVATVLKRRSLFSLLSRVTSTVGPRGMEEMNDKNENWSHQSK